MILDSGPVVINTSQQEQEQEQEQEHEHRVSKRENLYGKYVSQCLHSAGRVLDGVFQLLYCVVSQLKSALISQQ